MPNNKKTKTKTQLQKSQSQAYPFVSVCTPTFNRRPFLPYVIKCFENQTYPKDRIEWIIIDDGTDKVEDLFINLPQVKYFRYETQMVLGKKRNIANSKCNGDIIVYMDDDDYYPPERISHAVETLQKNPKALCAGSSEMYLFFKHIQKMYQFGPYGPNHSTAATFAFRKELLKITKYNENEALAEEKQFLKNYTIPFVQLDPLKSILVFSHVHNSFDKKTLLNQGENNPFVKVSNKKVEDFVKEEDVRKFFLEDIDTVLENYHPGKPENKPEVLKQIDEIAKKREEMMKQQMNNQMKYNEILHKNNINPNQSQNIDPSKKLNEMGVVINDLLLENSQLKDKVKYLEEKIKTIITEKIKEKQGKSETVTTTIVNNNNNNDNNNNDTENTFNVKTI
jgi:glycosyltransferase involved in cell wall biosynthesis